MKCERCDRSGHVAKNCFYKRDIRGGVLPRKIENSDSDSTHDSDTDYLGTDSEIECDE